MLPRLPMVGLKSGLFEAKHRKRMGPAIWLYGWLHAVADRHTGRLPARRGILEREQRQVLGLSHSRFADHWARLVEGQYLVQDGDGWRIARFSSIPVFFRTPTRCPQTDALSSDIGQTGPQPVPKRTDFSENGQPSTHDRKDSHGVVDVQALGQQQQDAYWSLVDIGVTQNVALELARSQDPDRILRWVEYAYSQQGLHNPAGLVVSALRGPTAPPKPAKDSRRYITGPYADYIQH